jgi:hypothetical protein
MTSISYRGTTDLIILTPVEDAATQRIGFIEQNFGKNRQYIGMANYRKQIFKIWTANATVVGGYITNTSNEISGEFLNKGSLFVIQLNNNIIITPALSAEITGKYQSEVHQGYFVMKPNGNLSVGLRQMLLKNKMTLSLTVNDILYTSKEILNTQYENVNNSLRLRNDTRYINLTLQYNFGSTTVKAARNKQTGIEDETSRAKAGGK